MKTLRKITARDPRIRDLRVHGSAGADGGDMDLWSDLDLVLTADHHPAQVAEEFASSALSQLGPLFTASREATANGYGLRLVLVDLRRIDVTVLANSNSRDPGATAPAADPLAELLEAFRFDAVLAAVKTARGDVLIGSHLALQLARHLLVAAMILRDRQSGTTHHRHGGTVWDTWAERLAAAPVPYTRAGISSAIRFHSEQLDRLLAEQAPHLAGGNQPLHILLDAVAAHAPVRPQAPA
ncbi:hypothetical protein ACIPLC_15270 [Kitasatospora sp. NPDC086801]|uniref:hypothetical protein n=1 Tax=unclassified Kitasatospora TaxID=2633591 RepID=UPI0038096ADC